jgi:3-oxoadipate enol-lactonase
LMYDQRGLGQTSKPDVAYSMADYADDAAALMAHVGWLSAAVIGISFGGMVAQHLTLRHRHLVQRLVLACTSSGGAGGSSFDLLAMADLPDEERIKTSIMVMDSRNDPTTKPPTWAPGFEVLARRAAMSQRLASQDPQAAIGARRQLEARAHHDTWNDLPSITIPTLCMGGTYDNQAPSENVRALATRIPNAAVEFFDGGHGFLSQDPTAWPRVIDALRATSDHR